MREKDILRDVEGLIVRILVLSGLTSWVVDCDHCRMPFVLDNTILEDMEPVGADNYRIIFTDEELDERKKAIHHNAFFLLKAKRPAPGQLPMNARHPPRGIWRLQNHGSSEAICCPCRKTYTTFTPPIRMAQDDQ